MYKGLREKRDAGEERQPGSELAGHRTEMESTTSAVQPTPEEALEQGITTAQLSCVS